MKTKFGDMRTVACLTGEFQLVSDSQDVVPIKEHIGEAANGYNAFFVRIENGDYVEVWGMCGIVPYLSKLISRLL
jgi:hypothetical protein